MPHGPWFDEGRRGPRMERGDLRYVILDLLENQPSYGYELIRALEDRFHGFYSPSPGTVYPTLQWLQDLGYVTAAEQDGRKMYTITDEGRRFLAARGPKVEEVWERMAGWWSPFDRHEFHGEMRDFAREMRDMGKNLRHDMRWADPDKLRRVREVVTRAAREIDAILHEPESGSGRTRAPAAPASSEEPGSDRGPEPGDPERKVY